MTDMPGWFAANNGNADLSGTDVLNVRRRMTTLRDAGQWVHIDLPLQSGLYATLILDSLVGRGVAEVRFLAVSHCWTALYALLPPLQCITSYRSRAYGICEPELSLLLSARALKLLLFR